MRGNKGPNLAEPRVRDTVSGSEQRLWLVLPLERRSQEKAPCIKVSSGSQKDSRQPQGHIRKSLTIAVWFPPSHPSLCQVRPWSLLLSIPIYVLLDSGGPSLCPSLSCLHRHCHSDLYVRKAQEESFSLAVPRPKSRSTQVFAFPDTPCSGSKQNVSMILRLAMV